MTVEPGRRHDVDWLRVLALGLLIIYHCALSFQPWAPPVFFIKNGQSIDELSIGMSLVNVWRIPILFVIAGMGARFAVEHRSVTQFVGDRAFRILVPFMFGAFAICPVSVFVATTFDGLEPAYFPNVGHLWFLGNLFVYVLVLLPLLMHVKESADAVWLRAVARMVRLPLGAFVIAVPMMAEAWLVDPDEFSAYGLTAHGFWLGLICFAVGIVCVSLGEVFWQAAARARWAALAAAVLLYLVRQLAFRLGDVSDALIALESSCWMLAVVGQGGRWLNQPSRALRYFGEAVYPVYIVHLPVQFGIAYYLFALPLPAPLKLLLLTAGTFGVSLVLYEYAIARVNVIRPLFGMKPAAPGPRRARRADAPA